jgi:myosin-5
LIAVNPFKEIEGLYDMKAFQNGLKMSSLLPPHVFSIAESGYRSVRDPTSQSNQNQTILVSGESGAGKTESTKFIMSYLAAISHHEQHPNLSTNCSSRASIETQALNSNPILESFGNARTLRNDNSSRFGKFVRLFFDPVTGEMIGTSTETYLLEKVRVVNQSKGERNFHIFYELVAGAKKELRKKLLLTDYQRAQDFRYINTGNCYERNDKVDDVAQFAAAFLVLLLVVSCC